MNGNEYKVGDVLIIGTGSNNGLFVYLKATYSLEEQPVSPSSVGNKIIIKKIRVTGNKRNGYKAHITTKISGLFTYMFFIKECINAGEIIKETKITKVKTDTIPKSVIIIKDTTKYLMISNKLLINGINEYYKQSRKGQHQTLVGTTLVTLGSLLITQKLDKPIEKFPYILITTGLTFNIVGYINRYLAYKHLDTYN